MKEEPPLYTLHEMIEILQGSFEEKDLHPEMQTFSINLPKALLSLIVEINRLQNQITCLSDEMKGYDP